MLRSMLDACLGCSMEGPMCHSLVPGLYISVLLYCSLGVPPPSAHSFPSSATAARLPLASCKLQQEMSKTSC